MSQHNHRDSSKTVPHYEDSWEIGNFINKMNLSFYEGNIIKYICRYKKKNGVEDLIKARNYLNQIINNLDVEDFS